MKFKALIIDDDPDSANLITTLMRKHHKEFDLIESAYSEEYAIHLLNNQQYHVIFLDIEISNQNSLKNDNLFSLIPASTKVVIVSGHTRYAFEAIKRKVDDFLEKPISPLTLAQCIKKLKFENPDITVKHHFLIINSQNNTLILKPEDIIMLIAQGPYTDIYTHKNIINATKTLGHLYASLNHIHFYRLSRGIILNLNHLVRIDKKHQGAGLLVFTGNHSLEISRLKKDQLIRHLQSVA